MAFFWLVLVSALTGNVSFNISLTNCLDSSWSLLPPCLPHVYPPSFWAPSCVASSSFAENSVAILVSHPKPPQSPFFFILMHRILLYRQHRTANSILSRRPGHPYAPRHKLNSTPTIILLASNPLDHSYCPYRRGIHRSLR